jgi:YbbR domain-containing protein
MRLLRRLFLHNAGLKLLALLLAFLLWAAYTREPRVEVGFDVPVEFVQIAENAEVAPETPSRVHVRVRGRSLLLRRLGSSDISVRVDLAGMDAGELRYQPVANHLELPPGVELVSITPADLKIQLLPRKP